VVVTLWLRRIRGVVGMGLTWAAAWALAGILIGVGSVLTPGLPWDAFFAVFDAPLPALGVPGFFGGALYALVLGVAARKRRIDELRTSRAAVWGALAGLVLGALPLLAASPLSPVGPPWLLWGAVLGTLATLSAASAAGSLVLARAAEPRTLADAGAPGPAIAPAERASAALPASGG
jgi:hypothetical protein